MELHQFKHTGVNAKGIVSRGGSVMTKPHIHKVDENDYYYIVFSLGRNTTKHTVEGFNLKFTTAKERNAYFRLMCA